MKQEIKIWVVTYLFIFPLLIYAQDIQETVVKSDSVPLARMKQAESSENNLYNQYFSNILPVAPTAGELMRYADIPVDWAHGIPSIEIPLYTIECGELSLPITLSYYAGGIKVDQVATWVGLGWSLNAGGVITANCIDDKYGNYQKNFCHNLMTTEEFKTYMKITGFDNNLQCETTLEDLYDRQTIPDLGSYNFMGYSGRFFLYDLKIRDLCGSKQLSFGYFNPTSRQTLSAKDLKGIQYDFDYRTTTYSYSIPYSINIIQDYCWAHIPNIDYYTNYAKCSCSCWLTKVVGPMHKDSIQIKYGTHDVSYKTMSTGIKSRIKGYTAWTDFIFREGTTSASAFNNETLSHDAYITEIIASNGVRVEFILANEREDLLPMHGSSKPKALSEIKVYTPSGNILKRWTFEYDYFKSYISHPVYPSSDLRLKLKSIKEYGSSFSDDPHIYRFSYYGEEPGEPQLPFRASFAGRDYFGYCNSVTNQSEASSFDSSFPNTYKEDVYKPTTFEYSIGRDLSVNEKFNYAYSLKSIQYPAGGKRLFKYNTNFIFNDKYGGLCIDKIINYYSKSDSTVQEFHFTSGSVTETPTFTRVRTRDEHAMPSNKYAMQRTIYDVSSTPFTNLASLTGGGIFYASAKEIRDDMAVEYFYLEDEDVNPRYCGYRVLVKYDPLDNFDNYAVSYEGEVYNGQPNFNFNFICPDYKYGHLTKKTIWSNSGYSLLDEIYEYEYQERDTVPIMQISFGLKEWTDDYLYYDMLVSDYITGKALLKNKTTYYYQEEDADPYEVQKQLVETYAYNEYDLPNNVTTLTSNNERLSVETRYVSDISASPYKEMVGKRMIDYPIEVIKRLNDKVIGGTLMTYINQNNLYLRDKIYELKPSATTSSSSFSLYNGTPSLLYGEPSGIVNKFTSYGKIAAMRGKDQVNVVYLWGYNNMYPIAEIKNATYDEVTNKISESDIEAIAARLEPASDDWNRINQLRSSLPHAHISVLTYKPLVGVTSICGPDERIVYYDYDSFGQLKEVYSLENGIKRTIENYEYHYSGK